MKFVTFRLPLLLIVLPACLLVSAAALGAPNPHRYVYRDMAFVTQTGHGTVTSRPRGVACPHRCRAVFVRGTHVVLTAKPAAGWRLASFTSKWCKVRNGSCGFDLVSPHDCSGGACPTGAFGVRVAFVRAG